MDFTHDRIIGVLDAILNMLVEHIYIIHIYAGLRGILFVKLLCTVQFISTYFSDLVETVNHVVIHFD